ncbi:MAG: hypothetical protein K8T89_09845 [Planctomycetes bacterium]|nr:hypothetical protein [Planctomycetota bacterium]
MVSAGPDGIFGNGDDVALPPVTTGADGIWTVPNAPPGDLRATVTGLPNGLTAPTFDLDGTGTPNVATFAGVSGVDRTDVDFGVQGVGSIGDRVWVDINLDGVDTGEPGISGVTVTATWSGFDGIPGNADDLTYTTTTDANGNYAFADLPLGSYQVAVDPTTVPVDLVPTYDLDSGLINPDGTTAVTLTALDPVEDGADFGYTGQRALGDRVWLDFNGDGIQDPNEPGLTGVTVTALWGGLDGDLATPGDNLLLTTVTGANGIYGFSSLPPGVFQVSVGAGLPPGLTNTGDIDGTLDGSTLVTLAANDIRTDIDFGYQGNSSISGFVYRDYSVDGIQQLAATFPDTGIAGVTVTLTGTDINGNVTTRTTVTAADGSYSFGGLLAGNYQVTETQPPPVSQPGGFYDGLDTVGTIGGTQTGTSPQKNQLAVTLGTGENGVQYNFGENPPADPFGFVYIDLNNNGIMEPGEPGIPGVAITVSGTAFAGTPLERPLTAADVPTGLTVFTNANGRWEFPIIPPGVYTFVEAQPPGFIDGLEENADPNGPNTVVIGNDIFSNVLLNPNPIRGPFNFGEIAVNGVIEGSVYVDRNGSGVRDPEEAGIWEVTVTLIGSDLAGNPASATVITDINGNFRFLGLRPGTYQLFETQPASFTDGLERVGSVGGLAGNDVIIAIGLGANQAGTLYQFGEGGLLATAVSKRMFLASTTLDDFLLGAPGSGVATVTYGLANAAAANANVNVNGLTADPGAPVIFQQDANLPAGFAANLNSGFSEPNVGTSTTTSTTTGNTGSTTTPSGNSTPPVTNLAIPTLLTPETLGTDGVNAPVEESEMDSATEMVELERGLDALFVSLDSGTAVNTSLPTVESNAEEHDAPSAVEIEASGDRDEKPVQPEARSSSRGWFLGTLAGMLTLANSPWKRSRKKDKSLSQN